MRTPLLAVCLFAATVISCRNTEISGSCVQESPIIVSNRISNPYVTCRLIDDLGREWIGTRRGLNRFNGYDYHQYFNTGAANSLPGNEILSILKDSTGSIWVGTDNGVAVYTSKDDFVRIPSDSRINEASQILQNSQGRIIVNFTEDLCIYDPETEKLKSAVPFFDRFSHYHQQCYLDGADRLWVVGPIEIRCFSTTDMSNIRNYPSTYMFTESTMLPDGDFIMTDGAKLVLFSLQDEAFSNLSIGPVKGKIITIEALHNDVVCLGLSDGSFLHYNISTQTVIKDAPDKIEFHPGRFNSNRKLQAITEGLSICSMSMDDNGNLFLFSDKGDLLVYDIENGTSKALVPKKYSPEKDIDMLQTNMPEVLADKNGIIWLIYPNQRQLLKCYFDGSDLQLIEIYPAFYPRAIVPGNNGEVWFGTRNEQVHCIGADGQSRNIQVYPKTSTMVKCLLPYEEDILVGAYNEPLMCIDTKTFGVKTPVFLEKKILGCLNSGIFNPTVMKMDNYGKLWIGTKSDGLITCNHSDGIVKKMNGAPCMDISAIELDADNNVWVSTADGIGVWNRADERFTNYSSSDGLGGDHFFIGSSCRLPDGTILFGGTHGLTQVNPKWTQENRKLPFVFEDLTINNVRISPSGRNIDRHLSVADKIILYPEDGNFSISFAALDLSGHKAQYWYRMEGFESDWVDAGSNREIYYSNMPAGHYRFVVRYSDSSAGQSDYTEASIAVRVKPSVWARWWMILLYLLFALALAATVLHTRRKLREEKKEAEAARAEKEMERRQSEMNMRFFSNISHEFRTPLTMISGPVSQLERSEDITADDRNLLEIVQTSTSRMLTLVNQLLDFGKLENDTLKLSVHFTEISSLVKMICKPFVLNATDRGIDFNLTGAEIPAEGYLDEDKLQKILSNLLSNALKFTPAGGMIEVRMTMGKDAVRISVADSGKGIPEDQTEKIFERYYQVSDDNKGNYNYGTGIGLYYSRALAELHHGHITAGNSLELGGADFTLTLPISQEAFSPEELDDKEKDSISNSPMETIPDLVGNITAAPMGKGQTVLVIDDDWDMQNYLKTLLGTRYQVITCQSAEEAIDKINEKSPDIILSDVAMPGKDGFELCREIKSNIQICHIPVILVTAKGTIDSQVEGLDMGADAYVTKPFDPSYLLALIRSQLENRRKIQGILNSAIEVGQFENAGELSSKDRAFMRQLYEIMNNELANEDLDITMLTDMMKISRTKFYYKIKSLTGKTPSEFFMQYKLNVAAQYLKEGRLNVSEIAIKTGFNTLQHFSKAFKNQFGVSPSRFK